LKIKTSLLRPILRIPANKKNGSAKGKLPKVFLLAFLWVLALTLASGKIAYAGVNINLVVVNPSSTETKKVPIKYYLPKELDSQDILSTSGLDVDYDIDKSGYFVHGTVVLNPKESRTIKIEVNDVWQIKEEEVDVLKEQIEKNLSSLKKTQYYDSAQILKDRIFEKLDYISAQQKNYSDNAERRIEEYRAHAEEIQGIRKNAFSADYLKTTPQDSSEDKTIKFVIEAKNPSETETKKFQQQHYLPAEVRSEHVVDSQGFDVRFDEKKQQSYLTKEDEFQPGETKRYEIVIKDIWRISEQSIDYLENRARVAFEGLKDSQYKASAGFILEGVSKNLDEIKNSQKKKLEMKKYIGTYRTNNKLFENAQENVAKLESMLSAIKAKKLEDLEKGSVKNVLQKMQALRGVMQVSEAVFGRKPAITHTWKVILAILAFVAIFTAVHFVTWWRKAQVFGEELALKAGGIQEIAGPKEKAEEKPK